jgi:predicted flap endonuclease-1-like 5' DNA nuclease
MNFSQLFTGLSTSDSNSILLWLLIAFLLGLLTGWFIWGRKVKMLNEALAALNSELNALKKKYSDLEVNYAISEKSLSNANAEIESLSHKVRKYSEENGQLYADLGVCRDENQKLLKSAEGATPAVMAAAAVSIQKDDLKVVEGIGPKIQELLYAAGIYSFKQLAEAPIEQVQAVLDEAGPRYNIHNPKTWGEQALLAHQGDWEALKALQESLTAGKNPEDISSNE